jgi:hypothetical protein
MAPSWSVRNFFIQQSVVVQTTSAGPGTTMKTARKPSIIAISTVFLSIILHTNAISPVNKLDKNIVTLYQSIDFNGQEPPAYDVFRHGLVGYSHLQQSHKLSEKGILTLIDFRKSANSKRLWVIDIIKKKLLFHSLTAHGRNTGDVFASKFSNKHNSHQSSLGFYITGNTYIGKHGISLKLLGIESGINDQAEARAIVMHGADYVSDEYIRKFGRLGRSFGCPAVPMELHKKIITTLAGGTCLFIYYPDSEYLAKTHLKGSEISAHLTR